MHRDSQCMQGDTKRIVFLVQKLREYTSLHSAVNTVEDAPLQAFVDAEPEARMRRGGVEPAKAAELASAYEAC